MRRRSLLRGLALAPVVLFFNSLPAQNVFVLPTLSGSTNPTVFTADPFTQAAVISAAATNTTWAFAGPANTFYLVSNTNEDTVQATGSSFSSLSTIANLTGATYAAITADGTRLLVESGGGLLTIIATSNNSIVNTDLFLGGTVIDLALSIDSARAFALVSSSAGLQLSVVNLSTGALIHTYALPGTTGTGLSVSPSGLIYVSTQNAVLEVDPNTLGVRYTSVATGQPGRLYFTADGKTGVAVNQTPVDGTEGFVFNLATGALIANIPQTSVTSNVTLDQIVPVNDNRVIAYSSESQSLFDITLDPPSVTPFYFSSPGAVSAVAASNSIPTANNPNTQFLFFTSNSTVYRVDLNAGQITGQQTLSGTAGSISFTPAAAYASAPATLVTYGDNQSVAPNAPTDPLVVKVVDAQGRPLPGVLGDL